MFSLFSACRQLEYGIQAIFGPSDPLLGAHIQSICEALDVPHIEARIGNMIISIFIHNQVEKISLLHSSLDKEKEKIKGKRKRKIKKLCRSTKKHRDVIKESEGARWQQEQHFSRSFRKKENSKDGVNC